MKFIKLLKSTLSVATFFIPQSLLARIASGVAIWAVESLVQNTKTTIDDKGLEMVKKIVQEENKNKNWTL